MWKRFKDRTFSCNTIHVTCLINMQHHYSEYIEYIYWVQSVVPVFNLTLFSDFSLMLLPGACIYCTKPECQRCYITAKTLCNLLKLSSPFKSGTSSDFQPAFLKRTSQSGEDRTRAVWSGTLVPSCQRRRTVAKVACMHEPALLISHIINIQRRPQIAGWQILFCICFLKPSCWVQTECVLG